MALNVVGGYAALWISTREGAGVAWVPMPSRVLKAAWRVRRRLKWKHELVEAMLEVFGGRIPGASASSRCCCCSLLGYASPILSPGGNLVVAMLIAGPADSALDLSWSIPAHLWTAYSDGHGSG